VNRPADAYVITVTRHDGSTAVAQHLHPTIAEAIVGALFGEDVRPLFASFRVDVHAPGASYASSSPRLPMDDALAWRQPDDAITYLLAGGR
jgi:prephenate dehydrogenase